MPLRRDEHHWGEYGVMRTSKPPFSYDKYFYLVVNSQDQDASLADAEVQDFVKTGLAAGNDYAFMLVDIASDARFKEDICKLFSEAYFEDLRQKCPLLMITRTPISAIANTSSFVVHPFRDYATQKNIIYDEMNLPSKGAREVAIAFLRRANRYIHLKPNIAGLGFNLNEIITDLIDRLESSTA